MNPRLLLSILLAAPGTSAAEVSVQETALVTCRAESPVDGSVWMGTSGSGILRLGRNGRNLRYTVSSGSLSSDTVKTLFFTSEKVLWILDGSGLLTAYTSTDGFSPVAGNITAAVPSGDEVYFSTGEPALYRLLSRASAPEKICDLPFTALALFPSVSATGHVFVHGASAVLDAGPSGVTRSWNSIADVSKTIPFEYETYYPQETVERGFNLWLLLIILLLFGALAVVFFLYLRARTHAYINMEKGVDREYVEETDVETPVSESVVQHQDELFPEPEKQAGEFTKRVIALINDHISDPDFDVEAIAAITGLSRIHVNRKLKAEGAPSPSVLIKNARMELAASYLKGGVLSISEISKRCGFRTPAYFATAFKDFFGCTPTEFL